MEITNTWQAFATTGKIEDYFKYVDNKKTTEKPQEELKDENIANINKWTCN